jgi:hypothetical protein
MLIAALNMRRIAQVLIVAGLALGFAAHASADTVWTLNDVTFTNGNSITGSFTTNTAQTAILGFSLSIAGPATAAQFTPTQMVDAYLPNTIGIANSDFSKYIDLYLASSLTSAGGTLGFTSGFDCNGCGVLILNADIDVTGVTAIPEPATGGLMLLGVGMMIKKRLARRREQTRATIA